MVWKKRRRERRENFCGQNFSIHFYISRLLSPLMFTALQNGIISISLLSESSLCYITQLLDEKNLWNQDGVLPVYTSRSMLVVKYQIFG